MFPLHFIRYPTSQGQSALTDRIHMPQPGVVLHPPGGRHISVFWWASHLSCPGGRHISVSLVGESVVSNSVVSGVVNYWGSLVNSMVGHGGSMNSMAAEGCEDS